MYIRSYQSLDFKVSANTEYKFNESASDHQSTRTVDITT